MSMIPKGGNAIWGDLNWSPEEGYSASKKKKDENLKENDDVGQENPKRNKAHYGRMISFGKDVAEASQSDIDRIDFRV